MINLSNATPAAPAGGVNVNFQKDGSGNVSAYLPSTGFVKPVIVFAPGVGTNAQILISAALGIGILFPSGAAASFAKATTAATASTVFSISKNGTPFATVTFGIGSSTGTFTQASDSTFVAGDIFRIDGPATADATLAGVSITLVGTTT